MQFAVYAQTVLWQSGFCCPSLPQQIRTILGEWSAKRTRSVPSTRRLYSDFVVHGILNPLFATEISFRCLNRNVTEQKLDLLRFASGGVAKPCTGSAEIVAR